MSYLYVKWNSFWQEIVLIRCPLVRNGSCCVTGVSRNEGLRRRRRSD